MKDTHSALNYTLSMADDSPHVLANVFNRSSVQTTLFCLLITCKHQLYPCGRFKTNFLESVYRLRWQCMDDPDEEILINIKYYNAIDTGVNIHYLTKVVDFFNLENSADSADTLFYLLLLVIQGPFRSSWYFVLLSMFWYLHAILHSYLRRRLKSRTSPPGFEICRLI